MPTPSNQINCLTGQFTHRLNHIEFRLTSEPLERLFQHLSGGQTAPAVETYSGLRHYRCPVNTAGIPAGLPGFSLGRFDMWGNRELILGAGRGLNLSLLTAVGLSEGVTITVPTVMSRRQRDEYCQNLSNAVLQLYTDYIRETTHTITLTATTESS